MEALTKREIARDVLIEMFRERKRIRIIDAAAAAHARGVSLSTLRRASRDLGVVEVHNGNAPAFWEVTE